MTSKLIFCGFILAATTSIFVSCNPIDSTAGKSVKEIYLSSDGKFTLDTIAHGLAIPFGMDWLPDGRLIFTERGKKDSSIGILDSAGNITRVCKVPTVDIQGQGGMLDILVHPDYKSNGWIYYSYAHRKEDTLTTLIVERAKLENNCFTQIQRIFEGFPYHNSNNHYGSRMLIKDGYLYLTMGERANAPDSAQSLSADLGKVIRLHDDGTVPADNPFVKTKGARPEIWSYGHRNLQGLAFQPSSGKLWESEHGPQGGDEVNIIQPGKNYGWPIVTFGEKYGGGKWGEGITMKDGMEKPVYFYRPSIAPSGMTFYTGDAFPGWKGSLFLGSLAYQHLNRLIVHADTIVKEERLLTSAKWRVRVVKQGPDGLLYIGVDNDGMLLRLRPYEEKKAEAKP